MTRAAIAQMIRVGTLPSGACEDAPQSETANAADPSQALQSKAIAIENDLRGTLRNFFGLKVGMVGKVRFEARIQELVEKYPPTWRHWWSRCSSSAGCSVNRIVILHRRLLAIVREDEVCRRLMKTPGVGPVGGADLSRDCRLCLPRFRKVQVRSGRCLG